MRTIVKGKNVEVPERVRDYAERKLRRLERLLDDRTDAIVEFSNEMHRSASDAHIAEVTLVIDGRRCAATRSASATRPPSTKSSTRSNARRSITSRSRACAPARRRRSGSCRRLADGTREPGHERRIVKTKRFAIEPMFEEDAVAAMEELGHKFFVFVNAETERIAILYARDDGDLGMIEPVVGGDYTTGRQHGNGRDAPTRTVVRTSERRPADPPRRIGRARRRAASSYDAADASRRPTVGAHLPLAAGMVKAVERAHEIGAEAMQIFTRQPDRLATARGAAARAGRRSATGCRARHRADRDPRGVSRQPRRDRATTSSGDPSRCSPTSCVAPRPSARATSTSTSGRISTPASTAGHRRGSAEGVAARPLGRGRTPAGRRDARPRELGRERLRPRRRRRRARDDRGGRRRSRDPDERVGFCLDTAHAWGAGIDVGTRAAIDAFLADFDDRIGLGRLVMVHLNDSRSERGSRTDRHEHLGAGRIGEGGLAHVLRHPALAHVPTSSRRRAWTRATTRSISPVPAPAPGTPLEPLPEGALELRGSARRARRRHDGKPRGRSAAATRVGRDAGRSSCSVILALAALLRFPNLATRGTWDGDQGRDMLVLRALVRDGVVPLLGPPTSIGDLHHGPGTTTSWPRRGAHRRRLAARGGRDHRAGGHRRGGRGVVARACDRGPGRGRRGGPRGGGLGAAVENRPSSGTRTSSRSRAPWRWPAPGGHGRGGDRRWWLLAALGDAPHDAVPRPGGGPAADRRRAVRRRRAAPPARLACAWASLGDLRRGVRAAARQRADDRASRSCGPRSGIWPAGGRERDTAIPVVRDRGAAGRSAGRSPG